MGQLSDLKLQQQNGDWLHIPAASLTFSDTAGAIADCRLAFDIDAAQYQAIEQEQSFNLTPEIKGPHTGNRFDENRPIHLQLLLKPDLLPTLFDHASTAEDVAAYLSRLSQQQPTVESNESTEPISSVLQTESWLCISVKQKQDSGEVGFNTFWHSINPALINNPDTTSDQLAEGIVNFVKEWTEVNLAEATQTATTQLLQDISETFGDLMDGALDNADDPDNDDDDDASLFDNVTAFFEQEDWPFVQIVETTSLRLTFRGDNGQWNCYAKVNPDQQTLLFYSICPIAIPEEKQNGALGYPCRARIAEFITRANYGMVIGNFELDYSDGEIRYKTSVDVEGSVLNSALIKQLVYTNVLTMDQYLPGILAVIEEEVEPVVALGRVE